MIVIPQGTEVKMEESCDCEWILISYAEKVGYVYSKYLSNNTVVSSKNTYSKT
jgi:uncharacterized protein YgiM (DUF1202 family)